VKFIASRTAIISKKNIKIGAGYCHYPAPIDQLRNDQPLSVCLFPFFVNRYKEIYATGKF
jgi:hypothetical protein